MPRLREPRNVAAPGGNVEAKIAEPEVEVVEPEVEVEVTDAPEPQPSEAMVALQRQLDDLKKSEEIQKQNASRFQQERDEALQRARDREAQVTKIQKEAYDSQADAIASALAAAGAEADKAQLDIENAISVGDPKAQAEAQRRLSMATANLARLEDGKAAIEARSKEPQVQPGNQQEFPQVAKDYINKHPEIMSDRRINNKAQYIHAEAIAEGIAPWTPAYFEYMDEHMGYKTKEFEAEVDKEVETQAVKPKGNSIVSAPPSRDIPGSNGSRSPGKVRLTKDEVEAAAVAGISVEEYAKQKQKRDQMIASGEYSNQR